jgi:hypothetical protein
MIMGNPDWDGRGPARENSVLRMAVVIPTLY